MTRVVQALISFGLLTVLSGAPFVAVLCAEWCLGTAHEGHSSTGRPAEANCHDEAAPEGGVLSAATETPCADHEGAATGSSALASFSRADGTVAPAAATATSILPPATAFADRTLAPPPVSARRAAPTHSVLRI